MKSSRQGKWRQTAKAIRLPGRGEQGVVMASNIFASALVEEGMVATGFPSFGVERRGASVSLFSANGGLP
jgi:Pyruvate/2-oxoacid:ferredoxin oxidoreductase gamma subunit